MNAKRKLRIALECRIPDIRSGIGSAILSLAHALSESEIEDQEYTFIVHAVDRAWLEPHIFGPCRLAAIERPAASRLKRLLGRAAPLRSVWNRIKAQAGVAPASDGYVEAHAFDIVHFTTPTAYTTARPSIYQPWDLQHAHYPQFFSKADFAQREQLYKAFCEQAQYVCVQTEWSRQDVIRHFGISADKVVVVRWGSVFDAYQAPSIEERLTTREKYHLPDQFFFYPAVTWPHKNHEDILRALHLLQTEHGRAVDVFFTGTSTPHRPRLEELARQLKISSRVHYLGFLTAQELQSIFSAATAMVFASRFEGFGLPVLEAFHARLPVLCSDASVLPEVAQDGALYFTPGKPEQLAQLMLQICDNPGLRERLVTRGAALLSTFSIQDTAKAFQQLYTRVAGTGVDGAVHPDRLLPATAAMAEERR